MADAATSAHEARFLVLAPTGRDAALTAALLTQAELTATVCDDIAELCHRVDHEGAAALMIAEEALSRRAVVRLSETLARQGSWSDLPVLVFTGAALRRRPSADELLASLGNVTLLDRPLRPITMISAARSALRARKRQYEARAELYAQHEAVRQRDQFLAMLGHELRNPLSAIVMALNLQGDGDGKSRRYREIMRRQVQHLSRLVDDLLDVSRVTSGKIKLQREMLDLVVLAERCVNALGPVAEAQRTTLDYRGPSTSVWVEADPVRLEQIIANLITNATKYTRTGGHIEVVVSATRDESCVEVRDNGVGIPEEMLGRVFDLFAQVEGTLDRAKGGMGIGLTLVRSLVELHGGTVEARSEGKNRGSAFSVRLPRAPPPMPVAAPIDARDASQHPSHDVLIVEDNQDSRELLAVLLAERGHRVLTAADGPSGVREAIAQRPDVLLVDIGLPGLDGYGVARKVRDALGSAVYLIAVTGYGQPDDRRRALAAGFDMHLTKPLDLRAIEGVLREPRRPSQVVLPTK